MQYKLTSQKQETIRQIQELRHKLAPNKEPEVGEPVPMEIGAITGEERNTDNAGQVSHSTKRPDNLFFMDPDHEEMRISEEPEVQNYWEARLTMESLSTLKTGRADHSQVICYHCNYQGHIKAKCPDRRNSNR